MKPQKLWWLLPLVIVLYEILYIMSTKTWFIIMTILAFGSVISFFQINSAWADRDNLNGLFTAAGVVLGVLAVLVLIAKVSKSSGNPEN